MEEINDGAGASGYEPPETAPNDTAPKEAGSDDDTDELGYQKPAGEKPPAEKPKEDTPPTEEPAKVEPVSGYGEEPPKAEPPKEKPAEETPPKDEGELQLNAEGVSEEALSKIKEIATKHKLPKEAAQALVDLEKSRSTSEAQAEAKRKQELEQAVAAKKLEWHKELKEDKDFGGDNFAVNIKKVDKLLTERFENWKKVLTAKGTMLPPYIMRDLAKLSDELNKTEKFAKGNPASSATAEAQAAEDDPTSFYKQSSENQ